MDSNLKDESRNRHREEALARRLGNALDKASQQSGESCPDAELMAAYHERALNPEETTLCETHFATCSRCRKILAVLAASDDTPLAEKEVARLGELIAAATQPVKTNGPKRWDWRMRWLAPALGVAAVLAVWFAVKPPWHGASEGSTGTLVAEAPKNEPLASAEAPPAVQLPKTVPERKLEKESGAPSVASKEQLENKLESAEPETDALVKKDLDEGHAVDKFAARARVAESSPEKTKQETMNSNGVAATAPPPPAPRAFAATAAPAAPPAAQSPTQAVTAARETPPVSAADSASGEAADKAKQAPRPGAIGGIIAGRSASDAPLNGRDLKAFAALSKSTVGISLILRPPTGINLWRAGRGGVIERSVDNGQTWVSQSSPLQQDWLAGAAVSDTVCWLVGRNAAIARTTDGEHWDKIPSPQIAADASGKLQDWTSIAATSDQSAIIMSTDQHRYSTQNGGKTWVAQ